MIGRQERLVFRARLKAEPAEWHSAAHPHEPQFKTERRGCSERNFPKQQWGYLSCLCSPCFLPLASLTPCWVGELRVSSWPGRRFNKASPLGTQHPEEGGRGHGAARREQPTEALAPAALGDTGSPSHTQLHTTPAPPGHLSLTCVVRTAETKPRLGLLKNFSLGEGGVLSSKRRNFLSFVTTKTSDPDTERGQGDAQKVIEMIVPCVSPAEAGLSGKSILLLQLRKKAGLAQRAQ